MAFRHKFVIIVCWIQAIVMVCFVGPLPSWSFRQQRQQTNRKTRKPNQKPRDRFDRWIRKNNNSRGDESNSISGSSSDSPKVLWIDGNNVRGIGKFEWNAVELQHRVVVFCHELKIANAIVVWDHGSHRCAVSRKYVFGDTGNEITLGDEDVAATGNNNNSDGAFCVNLVVLFSGVRQRADDVLVRESKHLVASSFPDDGEPAAKIDWSSQAFVTNDRELNYKLRRQSSTSNDPSIRPSRRKRRGKLGNYGSPPTSAAADNPAGSEEATPGGAENSEHPGGGGSSPDPLFCDSTGFLDLLCDLEHDTSNDNKNNTRVLLEKLVTIDREASESIETASASLRECSKSQRRGYNPRREKTWERCVQAETLRRFFLLDPSTGPGPGPPRSSSSSSNNNNNPTHTRRHDQQGGGTVVVAAAALRGICRRGVSRTKTRISFLVCLGSRRNRRHGRIHQLRLRRRNHRWKHQRKRRQWQQRQEEQEQAPQHLEGHEQGRDRL
mmetsp:Transcript_28116/g.58430  ORF Transcript_28116/g.58430 Transcript_28116/m.58430 type:complete len:496 (-) Transcript_28116:1160-2647(-)